MGQCVDICRLSCFSGLMLVCQAGMLFQSPLWMFNAHIRPHMIQTNLCFNLLSMTTVEAHAADSVRSRCVSGLMKELYFVWLLLIIYQEQSTSGDETLCTSDFFGLIWRLDNLNMFTCLSLDWYIRCVSFAFKIIPSIYHLTGNW